MTNHSSWKIGWGITSLCNMNCPFCYSKTHRIKGRSSNIRNVLKFIRHNACSIDSINFGTGESALMPEWWNLLPQINDISKVIKLGVTTNGSLLGKEHVNSNKKGIVANYINDVDVSIDFANPEIHNYYRSNNKAFSWAIETLKCCDDIGIEKSVVMVATEESFTKPNLAKLIALTKQYGCNLRINIYRPLNSWNATLSVNTFYQSLSYLCSKMDVISWSDPLLSAITGENKYIGDFTGKTSCRILEDGSISPSTYLISGRWLVENIYSKNVLSLDNLPLLFKKILPSEIPDSCKSCEFKEFCRGGAIDRRWIWYKSFNNRDPYCPFRLTNPQTIINTLKENISFAKKQIDFVHDGYLPTIILTNK